ncbi:hypothetical protein VCHENC02_3396B, partial [Vibrio harveyi]
KPLRTVCIKMMECSHPEHNLMRS